MNRTESDRTRDILHLPRQGRKVGTEKPSGYAQISYYAAVQGPATPGNLPKRHNPDCSPNRRRCNGFFAPPPRNPKILGNRGGNTKLMGGELCPNSVPVQGLAEGEWPIRRRPVRPLRATLTDDERICTFRKVWASIPRSDSEKRFREAIPRSKLVFGAIRVSRNLSLSVLTSARDARMLWGTFSTCLARWNRAPRLAVA